MTKEQGTVSNETRSAFFIGGATSKTVGFGALDRTFRDRYGDGNVVLHSSVLFGDNPDPQRYSTMSRDLASQLQRGPVDIMVHSFGAGELVETVRHIEENDPAFFTRVPLDSLSATFVSPTLPRTLGEGLDIGRRYVSVGLQEGGALKGHTLPGPRRGLHGIVANTMMPPEGISAQELHDVTRETYPDLSHVVQGTSSDIVSLADSRDYRPILTSDERERVEIADRELVEGLRKSRREKAGAIYRRGVSVNPITMGRIRTGDWPEMGDTQMEAPNRPITKDSLGLQLDMWYRTLGRGEAYRGFVDLASRGMETQIVIPEYDILYSPAQAKRFGELPNTNLVIAEHATHGFPWQDQPDFWLKLVDHKRSR